MSLDSSTLAIGNSLVALIQGFQNPATGQPLYQYGQLGAIYDPGDYCRWFEVTFQQGESSPEGRGSIWRIGDAPTFLVTSGFGPYDQNSTAVETDLLTARDLFLPLLRKHFAVPNSSNPTTAIESVRNMRVEQSDRARLALFPSGHAYRLWDVLITVSQQYNVTMVTP